MEPKKPCKARGKVIVVGFQQQKAYNYTLYTTYLVRDIFMSVQIGFEVPFLHKFHHHVDWCKVPHHTQQSHYVMTYHTPVQCATSVLLYYWCKYSWWTYSYVHFVTHSSNARQEERDILHDCRLLQKLENHFVGGVLRVGLDGHSLDDALAFLHQLPSEHHTEVTLTERHVVKDLHFVPPKDVLSLE